MDIEKLKRDMAPLDFTQQVFRSPEQQEYFRHYKLDLEDRYPELQHFFGSIESGAYQLACHYYRSPAPKGCCFILHGYYDHSGLFGHIIDFCIQRNLSVVIFDLPGHGLSSGERVSINDFSEYQTVLNDVLTYFEDALPDPWYAIAQSTGGAILMDYLQENPRSIFTKTILLAPLVRPMGWKITSILITLLKTFIKKIPRSASNSSSDKTFKKFIKNNDPCQSPTVSLVWLSSLQRWIKKFLASQPCHHGPLVIQGRKDSTVDWLYNMGIIKKKFPAVDVIYIDGARHHLANEREEILERIFQEMDNYLEK
jgi:alpha-beta hydrolase superfamily lysophospholipase